MKQFITNSLMTFIKSISEDCSLNNLKIVSVSTTQDLQSMSEDEDLSFSEVIFTFQLRTNATLQSDSNKILLIFR